MRRLKHFLKNRKKGFTLIELIVNMAIIGIVMVIVTTLTSMSLQSFNRQQLKLDAMSVKDMVVSKIKSEVLFSSKAKMTVNFEEKLVYDYDQDGNVIPDSAHWLDQSGDGIGDRVSTNANGSIVFPVCVGDIKEFSAIYERNGRLYKVAQNALATHYDAATVVDGVAYAEGSSNMVEERLMDETLYRGYNVKVRFNIVCKTITSTDGKLLPDGNIASIKLTVDVYNGSIFVYSGYETISFVQRDFNMPYDVDTWQQDKTVLMYRG